VAPLAGLRQRLQHKIEFQPRIPAGDRLQPGRLGEAGGNARLGRWRRPAKGATALTARAGALPATCPACAGSALQMPVKAALESDLSALKSRNTGKIGKGIPLSAAL